VAKWQKPDGSVQLAAYVVPVAGSQTLLDADQNALLAEEIRRFLAQQIPPDLLPRIVTIAELPRGVPDGMSLPPVVQSRPALDVRYAAPRDFVEQELARIWSDLLGVHPIGIYDNFAELGGRSVLALSLITRIEQRFNRKVPIVALYGQPTIAHLADWLRRSNTSQTSSSLVAIQPHGAWRPLICVHPAGGTVFCYAELSRYLGGEQPVFGLQARGIDGLQSPHTSVAEMAASYVEDIRAQFPSGPYRLCGWSTGGIIAFEVACHLQKLGESVELLALFDAGMPAAHDRAFDKDDLLPMLAMMFPGQSPEELAELQQSGFEKQLEYFQRRAELAQLVVGAAGNAKHVYDVFQANVQAITEHQPSEYSGQLTLFRAANASTPMHRDEFLGWKSRANQISVYEVAGDHVNMFRPPAIQTIASRLSTLLSRP
jgi:thioesterase domain-containing protein